MDAPRLRRVAARRSSLHHARGYLRHSGRRVVLAHHPVHHLWRVPAAFRRRQVLHRFFHGAHGPQGQQRRPHRGAVVVPARWSVRFGRRHHRDDRRRRLSADAAGGVREERGRRTACRRRAGRHHFAARARRRRLPDRRVPQDQLPRRDLDGDHPDLPLLPVAAVHGRTRCQAVPGAHRGLRAAAHAGADDAPLRLSLHLADLDHHLHVVGLLADPVGVLVDGAHLWDELSHPRDGDHAEEAGARLVRRLDQRADRRDHLRDRRHHRRRRHADRARTEVLLDRDRLRRRQPAADRDLYRADRVDRRPGGAGDRLLHHLRRDCGARHGQARRARLRRPHVHLLLFGAVGSFAADGALAVCRRGDHRRRSLPDHAAGVEIHAARLSGPVRIRARPARHRFAAQAAEGRLVDRYRSDHRQDRARPRRAGGGRARLGPAPDDHGRAPAAGAGRPVPGVSEPARSADGAHDRPRHQLHRDIWLGDRRRGPAKTAHAAGRPADADNRAKLGRNEPMKRKVFAISALAVSAALIAGAALAQQGLNIAIATGGTGGVYYPLGGGMANVLSKHVPGMQASARVTGGSVDNLKLIGSQQSEGALVMVDAALDALKGEDKFKGNPVEVRTLMVLYPNRMHVVSMEGTGVEKMSDLKGKRVSTGSPGSATEVMAFRVIEAAGLDKDKDMRRERLGVAESVNALKDRKIDAFFWVGGLPTAAVTDLGATPNVKIKMIDHADTVDKMNKKYDNLYTTGVIPAKMYPGQDKDNSIAVVQNILVANAKMSDKVAYDIVKTFIERRDELVAVHAEADSIKLENQSPKNSPIPWHPGAVKYFSEKGLKMN